MSCYVTGRFLPHAPSLHAMLHDVFAALAPSRHAVLLDVFLHLHHHAMLLGVLPRIDSQADQHKQSSKDHQRIQRPHFGDWSWIPPWQRRNPLHNLANGVPQVLCRKIGISTNRGPPIAGWFVRENQKIPSNGWFRGTPHLWKPPYKSLASLLAILMLLLPRRHHRWW